MPDAPKAQQRFQTLIEALNTVEVNKPISLSELARIVGCDPELLRRDLEILSTCDIEFFYIDIDIDDNDMVTLLRVPFALSLPLRLTPEQMLAISLALKMAGADSDDTLMDRITDAFADSSSADLLANNINIMSPGHTFEVFEAVSFALQVGFQLEFDYTTNRGETKRRRADVARITSEREGWYFHGYDHDRHKTRSFKLSRMANPSVLSYEKSLGRNNLDIAEDTISALGQKVDEGAPYVTLIFASKSDYIPRDWPLACQPKQLVGSAGGGLKVDVPLINREYLIKKVVSLGGACSVKAPADLRADVKRYAENLAQQLG